MAPTSKTPTPGFKAVAEGAKAHDALLRDLFKGLVPLLARTDLPLFIKVVVAGLIILCVSTSFVVVILIADVMTSMFGHEIDVRSYLSFLAAIVGILLLVVSFAARATLRFEDERALEANMEAVMRARRQRRGSHLVVSAGS